jgi:hypothetical protein
MTDDRCEAAGRWPDQIAYGEVCQSDPPVDRRMDLRIGEINLGLVEGRLRNHHIGFCRPFVGGALVDGGLRDVLAADEVLAAFQLQRRIGLRCLGLGEIGLLLIDRRFVSRLFDAKQEVAGPHVLTFGEIALLDEPGHPRHDVHLVDRHDTADEFARIRHLAARNRDHRDGRRRDGLGNRAAAARHEARARNSDCPS